MAFIFRISRNYSGDELNHCSNSAHDRNRLRLRQVSGLRAAFGCHAKSAERSALFAICFIDNYTVRLPIITQHLAASVPLKEEVTLPFATYTLYPDGTDTFVG